MAMLDKDYYTTVFSCVANLQACTAFWCVHLFLRASAQQQRLTTHTQPFALPELKWENKVAGLIVTATAYVQYQLEIVLFYAPFNNGFLFNGWNSEDHELVGGIFNPASQDTEACAFFFKYRH